MEELAPLLGYKLVEHSGPPRIEVLQPGIVGLIGVLEREAGTDQDAPALMLPTQYRPPQTVYVRSDSRPPGYAGEWDHDRNDSIQKITADGAVTAVTKGEPRFAIFAAIFATAA